MMMLMMTLADYDNVHIVACGLMTGQNRCYDLLILAAS